MSLDSDTPEKQDAPIIPARPVPAPQAPEAPQHEPETTPEEAPEEVKPEEHKPAKKKRDWSGIALDTLLVLLLGGVLGGGMWYLKLQLDRYHVPGPFEIAGQQNLELCQKRESLQAAAYHADEQLHLRARLADLVQKGEDLQRRIDEKKQAVDTQHQKVLALQHQIRQEDKTDRSIAKGLLPGMPIGDATTTTGKVYPNAVIHRLEPGKITIRTPEGQMRFPTSTLVKDKLPDFVRYAFGLDEMVDMSDFEVTNDQPAPKKRKGKLIADKPAPKAEDDGAKLKDYDPAAGAPVVDTDSNSSSTLTGGSDDDPANAEPAPADNGWKAPEGELPF